ncbi:dephospho-CoA kinase [Peptoniphilaceae bacterium SGI.131]
MKSKKVIGITGSIATGKSTLAGILRDKGYFVLDTDRLGHELMQKGQVNYNNIVEYFGKSVLGNDGNIDRKKLSDLVFSDRDKLEALNSLTHSNIFNKIRDIIKNFEGSVIFIELPILFELLKEGKLGIEFDETWLIYVDKDRQIERLMRRNAYTRQEAVARVESQMDIEEKRLMADFVIENTRTPAYIEEQINKRLENL